MDTEYKILNISLCLGIVIAFLLLLFFIIQTNKDNRNFTSQYVGNRHYKVLTDKPNKENAARILQTVDNNLINLIKYINLKYTDKVLSKEPKDKQILIKTIIERLNRTYKSDNLKENYPTVPGKDVSFNINKGQDISLCLRNYNQPHIFHQLNDIMFVSIHELAHSCNESYGHDSRFWMIFRILLENSTEIGIFKSKNYKHEPIDYCSMQITYSPLHDFTLEDTSYFNNDSKENFINIV